MFADDTALYKEVKSPSDQSMLQDDLSKVFEWSCKWQLNLNPSKCETICISYKRSPPPTSYQLNDHVLSTKSVVRYLGILINSHLKWSDHVKHINAKATRSLNILWYSLYVTVSAKTGHVITFRFLLTDVVKARASHGSFLNYSKANWEEIYLFLSQYDFKELYEISNLENAWHILKTSFLL